MRDRFLKTTLLALTVFVFAADLRAQEIKPTWKDWTQMSDKFYLYWGWNRGWYTKSDIRLYGSDHDFTLEDVRAEDLQTDFSVKEYFYITRISIPQTNLKLGYFLNEKYSIAAGFDHMKYRIVEDQSVRITGDIDRVSSYQGRYENEDITLSRDFLMYNHTDGLNYVFGEFNRHDELFSMVNGKVQLRSELGVSVALLRPKTAVRFLEVKGPNVYHNAGYGVNGKVGLNLLLFRHISLMTELKGGYINMPNIRATANKEGQASQQFGFLQANVLLGATFGLW
ncbi:MAG: hypothetical protein JJ975_16215 [Bacteroidia bacterium]|nr:hypothetical protein [Bacteroidia bacterium]